MTKEERRDMFAAAALTGLLASLPTDRVAGQLNVSAAARSSWLVADAMMSGSALPVDRQNDDSCDSPSSDDPQDDNEL